MQSRLRRAYPTVQSTDLNVSTLPESLIYVSTSTSPYYNLSLEDWQVLISALPRSISNNYLIGCSGEQGRMSLYYFYTAMSHVSLLDGTRFIFSLIIAMCD